MVYHRCGLPLLGLFLSLAFVAQGLGSFNQLDLDLALRVAEFKHQTRLQHEERVLACPHVSIARDSPEFRHSGFVSNKANLRGSDSRIANDAIRILAEQFRISRSEVQDTLRELNITNTPLQQDSCAASITCTDSKYRSFDGSCNNLENGKWGQSGQPQGRWVDNTYADGIETVRSSKAGGELPSPRYLTQTAFLTGTQGQSKHSTQSLVVWGQFIAHDIILTPAATATDGSAISCCSEEGGNLPSDELHAECLPIQIPEDDPFFGNLGKTCMNFARSDFSSDCESGARAQLNLLTPFIDANNVYGATKEKADQLRSFEDGKLKVKEMEGDNFLPGDRNAEGCAETPEGEDPICFDGGDIRVNEQPTLAMMHTIWMRQHNLIASGLKDLNPSWTDENLFQETRRIIIAQHQHITYNEYLPEILGWTLTAKEKIRSKVGFKFETYNSSVDPNIPNAFGSAAFRFGHSTMAGELLGYNVHRSLISKWPFSNYSFAPSMVYNSAEFDELFRGLALQKTMLADKMFSPELSNRLFAGNETSGLDLPGLNIQRGRDHGIGTYMDYRRACGLSVDLSDIETDRSKRILGEVYADVEDIDLYVGGMMEKHMEKAKLGPTFVCIILKTFKEIKKGDRYFYSFSGETGSFTRAQQDELVKTTLARVMCDNSIGATEIQPQVFRRAAGRNKFVSCDDLKKIPRPDLSAWAGEPVE